MAKDKHTETPQVPASLGPTVAAQAAAGPPPGPAEQAATSGEIAPPAPGHELPSGVFMHNGDGQAQAAANLFKKNHPEPPQVAKPPADWKGTYCSCGGCGAFLGNERTCKNCSPPVIDNIHNPPGMKC